MIIAKANAKENLGEFICLSITKANAKTNLQIFICNHFCVDGSSQSTLLHLQRLSSAPATVFGQRRQIAVGHPSSHQWMACVLVTLTEQLYMQSALVSRAQQLCLKIRAPRKGGFAPRVGRTPRGSCNRTLLRRVLRRFSNNKCFLEGFLEGAL